MDLPPIFSKFKVEGVATTHQADCRFGQYAGSQCLSNCVIYLAQSYFNKESPVTDTNDLDDVLRRGSTLDFILRRSGTLGYNQYAQLHHVPSFIRTDAWSAAIFQSQEYFGLIGIDAAIREPFIESLKSILTRNYSGTVQYFLFICGDKAGAVIIKNKTFYLFDPHCVPHVPNSPAHVISSPDPNAILEYVSPPDREYTGSFLYIMPSEYVNPEHYITNHYRTITFSKVQGPQIDISTGIEPCTIEDISSPPRSPEATSKFSNRAHAPSKTTNAQGLKATTSTSLESRGLQPFATPQNPADGDTDTRLLTAGQPQPTAGHQEFHTAPGADLLLSELSASRGRKRKLSSLQRYSDFDDASSDDDGASRVRTHEDAISAEVIWMDDDISPLYSPSDTPSFDDVFDSPPTPPEPTRNNETADANGGFLEQLSGDAETPFSAFDDILLTHDFSSLDKKIEQLIKYKAPSQYLPNISDKQNGRPVREAAALQAMDKMMTNIILEHGLITDAQARGPSACKNVLQFFVLWGEKLGIPISDAKRVLDLDLQIIPLYAAVKEDNFKQGVFKNHLTSKLNKCLASIRSARADAHKKIVSAFNAEGLLISSSETNISISAMKERIAKHFSPDFLAVYSADELKHLLERIQALRTGIEQRNKEIQQEDLFFSSVITALDTFQPPPKTVHPIEITPQRKTDIMLDHLASITAKLTEDATEALNNYLETPSEHGTHITNIPNFSSIVANIISTLKIITYAKNDMQLDVTPMTTYRQQLLYLGGELATIFNLEWPYDTVSPVEELPVVAQVRAKMESVTRIEKNRQALDQILGDAETLLDTITAPSARQDPARAMSIPILETYITNAGALIGSSHNARFEKLKAAIHDLASSESFIIMLLNNTRLENISDNLVKIDGILTDHSRFLTNATVVKTLQTLGNSLTRECVEALDKKDTSALTAARLLALQTILGYASVPDHETLTRVVSGVTDAQRVAAGKEKDKWARTVERLTELKRTVSQSRIDKAARRKLATIISRDLKEAEASQETVLEKRWKEDVLKFQPSTSKELEDFLQSAPSAKARRFAEKHLQANQRERPPSPTDTVPMDYTPTPLPTPQAVSTATAEKGKAAWNKIQQAFQDFNFHLIDASDWQEMAAEYSRHGSSLPGTVGPKLARFMETISTTLNDILTQKLTSLLPNGPAFSPPAFDWIAPYQTRVNAFLRTIGLPMVRDLAEKIHHQCQTLSHAVQSGDLQQATVGTSLERPAADYRQILSDMRTAYNDHGIAVRSEAAAYVDAINSTANVLTPPKPNLEVPQKLMTAADALTVQNFPEFLKTSILQQEQQLIALQRAEFRQLEDSLSAAEKLRKSTQDEIAGKMATTITQLLPLAPVVISSRPLNLSKPIEFLSSTVYDKILDREPYETAVAGCAWLETAIKSVMVYGRQNETQQLTVLLSEVEKQRALAQRLHHLELSAKNTDDVNVLQQAIDELAPQRVKGGKPAVEAWKQKLENIESLIRATRTAGEISSDLEHIGARAVVTLAVRDLGALYDRCLETANHLKRANLPEGFSDIGKKLSELQTYIKHKKQFLEHFETTQPEVFRRFPLSQAMPENASARVAPDPLSRLADHLHMRGSAPHFTKWVETMPSIDPEKPAHVPTHGGAPLHLQITYSNVLEALFSLTHLTRHPVATATGLESATKARRGTEAATWLDGQWQDIAQTLQDVLDAYEHATPHEDRDAASNAFFAMCVFTQIVRGANRAVTLPKFPGATADFPEEIVLTPRECTTLVTAMWPTLAAAILRLTSYSEALGLMSGFLPLMFQALPHLTLESQVKNGHHNIPPRVRCFAKTEAIPYFPAQWQPTNLELSLWGQTDFLQICDNNQRKARLAALTWAITTIDGVVLDQLWSTFKPMRGASNDTYVDLIKTLHLATFGPRGPTPSREANTERLPYVYGQPTGYCIAGQSTTPVQTSNVPVSAFETVLGAMVFHVPIRIFLAAAPKRLGQARGGMGLLAPILDCVPNVEPFKSLYEAPRKPVPVNSLSPSLHPPDERQIFSRQASWLSYRYSPEDPARWSTPPLLVVIDPENLVTATYASNVTENFEGRPFYVMPGPYPADWPKTLSVSSDTSVTHLSHGEICNLFTTLSREHASVQGKDIFAAVPTAVTLKRTTDHPTLEPDQRFTDQVPDTITTPRPTPSSSAKSPPTPMPASPPDALPAPDTAAHGRQRPELTARDDNANQPARTDPPTTRNERSSSFETPPLPNKSSVHSIPQLVPKNPASPETINHRPPGQVTEPKGIFGTYRPKVRTEPAKPIQTHVTPQPAKPSITEPRLPVNPPTANVPINTTYKPRPNINESHDTTPGTQAADIAHEQYEGHRPLLKPRLTERPRSTSADALTNPHQSVPDNEGPHGPPAREKPVYETETPIEDPRATSNPRIRYTLPQTERGALNVETELTHREPERRLSRTGATPHTPEPDYSPWTVPGDPTIAIHRLEHPQIIENIASLTVPVPRVTPIPPTDVWVPLVHVNLQHEEISRAKNVLMRFIQRVRRKLQASSDALSEAIARIKFLYL
ncbi:ORF64 [macacine gammaherpesvirus 12]|uniref:ORF64 n=1 Tax=macacine gammaherpesvirus 12 TaxID=2560571 RepID=A0A0B5CYX6_9GAMA|nr:ORF64 [Macaca nemestrina rhadinovirus 2]AJE29720.1 ORF64 [Macaca nemestrina rhadinovirus 2]